jgi:hypothetical protein
MSFKSILERKDWVVWTELFWFRIRDQWWAVVNAVMNI